MQSKADWVGVALGCLGFIGLLAVYSVAMKEDLEPYTHKVGCRECHYMDHKRNLTTYFREAGSQVPEEMADAVLATKSPRLLAAIANTESNGNPRVRNSGWKKRHHGAFQVNPRYWGQVPHDAAGQAKQAEDILIKLTSTLPIEPALSAYGGDSTDNYANTILAELTRVP